MRARKPIVGFLSDLADAQVSTEAIAYTLRQQLLERWRGENFYFKNVVSCLIPALTDFI